MLKRPKFADNMFLTIVALVAVTVGFMILDDATCKEWGPKQPTVLVQPCGDGCWQTIHTEYRQCLRRKWP